jgi:predicted PurR-regulated permease PerM
MTNSESDQAKEPGQGYRISRVVSFLLLVGIIVILGVIFYKVMARFVVPLFLSALLVVIFRPLHDWVLEKVNGRQQIAALMTTLIILLLVLVPVSTLVFMGATEGLAVAKQVNTLKIVDDLSSVREKLGIDMPKAREIRQIELELAELQSTRVLDEKTLEAHESMFFEIMNDAVSIAKHHKLQFPVQSIEEGEKVPDKDMRGYWRKFGNGIADAKILHQDVIRAIKLKKESAPEGVNISEELDDEEDAQARQLPSKYETIDEYLKTIGKTNSEFLKFKYALLGGRTRATIVETANPTSEELQSYTSSLIGFFRDKLFALGGSITSFLASTVFGAVIMIIGLYFFLLDGPAMLKGLHQLSPIDDQHEEELVLEFARVSRAVVVATLLSAIAQGLLAGLGFWFCGLDSIFLLTLLSGVLAMVPFVGAAAVWIPCALYLFFVDNNIYAAIGLAVYGGLVISMADNFIKPWILHGQSNLHPLLALLSVIGGVAVLGPIGILVGPMIVVFLQTLLKILQREMYLMENEEESDSGNTIEAANA